MPHCLAEIPINPLSSSKICLPTSNPRFAHTPISYRNKAAKFTAVQGTDNLENFRRANKQQISQMPNQRSVPVAPNIGLWDRFPTARTVQQMMETMDRIMEDPFAYNGKQWPDGFGYGRGRTPWEIKEAESEYKLRFDMPGMTKQDVKVWVEEKMLVVRAEKLAKDGEEWSAKSYGKYNSRIALPENIQYDKIKAEVKDGVLYITVPKASGLSQVFDISVD